MELAANHRGVTFTRTSRPATAVVYGNEEKFEIGKGKVRAGSDVVFMPGSNLLSRRKCGFV